MQEHREEETSIMQMLDKDKMEVIEKSFTKEGLDIYQFIRVMHRHLNFNKEDPAELTRATVALIDLFREIDVNGDNTMEWEEFNNHVIELGMLRNDRSFKNVIKNYYPSEHIQDREKHENGIEQVYFVERLNCLIILEKDSARFKVYNAANCSFINEVVAHKTSVLCAEYIPCQDLIATSSNDLTINFWESSSFKIKQIVSVPEIQLCVKYADWKAADKQLIYTGGTDAIIHIYDAHTLKEKDTMSGWNPFFKRDEQQHGHSGPIGDILPIESQQTLVTASYDTKICLWDSVTHSPKKTLYGHNKGVYSLDWSDFSPMNQCLVSAGLDHEAYIWNTYVSTNIFLLRGHNHPLTGVKCLPNSPQIITADMSGMVKVWDVRNFLCVQTFNQKDQINSFCLTYGRREEDGIKKRFVCAGKKLHFFEYDEPKDQFLTDEKICAKVLFNDTLLVFITLHPDCVKVWDAISGKLTSVYRELSVHELTCAILDSRKRKLFIGTMGGEIFTVNIRNGAKMREFISHVGVITGLCHWTGSGVKGLDERSQDQRRVISISNGKGSGSSDKKELVEPVFIHDEDSPQGAPTSLRYKMNKHEKGCNTVTVKEGTELLASCSDDGTIVITNLITFRQFVLARKQSAAVTKVIFLDPHDCLVATDEDGIIRFFGIYESKFRNQMILQTQYTTSSFTKREETFPVTVLNFERENKILLLGDSFGNIQLWDISQVCDKVDEHKTADPRKKAKSSQEEEGFITAPMDSDRYGNIFFKSDIKRLNCIRKAHSDGITHIEVVRSKYSQTYIASSSFDCCVHIWSFDGKKHGSLILGHDRNWNLRFDIDKKDRESSEEAKLLLEDLKSPDLEKNRQKFVEDEEQEQLKRNVRREKALREARQLIGRAKEKKAGDRADEEGDSGFRLDSVLNREDDFSIIKEAFDGKESVLQQAKKSKKK